MPKRTAKRNNSQSEEQEIEDIMAWGNRKQNYYQDDQNQYSELSEEEEQAKKIYENQLQQMGNQNFYQLPQEQNQSQSQGQEEEQTSNQLSHAYLTKQIKNMAKLGIKISMQRNSQIKTLLESHVQTYLMSIIALRELNIPHVEYHPILNQIMQMKQDINNLKGLLETSTHQEPTQDRQESFDQDQHQADENQDQYDHQEEQDQEEDNPQFDQGLKIYEQAKMKQQQLKKQKKQEKKIQRNKNQKPMFAKVKQNEGRLANQKILKNKGLMKKRKKIDRNSRVKHRRKFQKATSKRRAYGHLIRQNPGRQYEGQRNIKFGRIASTKLK